MATKSSFGVKKTQKFNMFESIFVMAELRNATKRFELTLLTFFAFNLVSVKISLKHLAC